MTGRTGADPSGTAVPRCDSTPTVVLVAGVPRSGSTWLFNAVRCLLESSGASVHAGWVEEYRPQDPAAIHVVKAHDPGQVGFRTDLVLTTRRPTEACLASLLRMGWLDDDPDAIRRCWHWHASLYAHWHERSDLEIAYDEIMTAPCEALQRLAYRLGLATPQSRIGEIAAELAALEPPAAGGHDPRTLLHPGHRSGPGARAPNPGEILRLVLDDPEGGEAGRSGGGMGRKDKP